MASFITPTIGRKVWLFATAAACAQDSAQAFDATIIYVHPDGKINVYYVNHWGTAGSFDNVELRDPSASDCHGKESVAYCTWMPYQVGQAKKD